MISNLISALDKFWEVEHKPKTSLQCKDEEYYVDLKTGNIITMVIVITLFTVSALFIGAGALS